MKIKLTESQFQKIILLETGIMAAKKELNRQAKLVNKDPSEAQKIAGNYKKGHINIHGLQISIKTPKGGYRKYRLPNGEIGKNKMPCHYGYFTKTIGHDGDAIDVFIGDNFKSDKIFAIDQNFEDGNFDETKIMLNFASASDAKRAYLDSYSKDWKGFRCITETDFDSFKKWLYDGKKQKKPFVDYVEFKKKQ